MISPEFGWLAHNIEMEDFDAESEYFMMRSDNLYFINVQMKGKYSFQYIEDSVFENCTFDTKDAFWHAKNVTVPEVGEIIRDIEEGTGTVQVTYQDTD